MVKYDGVLFRENTREKQETENIDFTDSTYIEFRACARYLEHSR